MTLQEILETEGLKNVQVHPFFNNLENPEEASIDDMCNENENLVLLKYGNEILDVSISLTYQEGLYSVSGDVNLKVKNEDDSFLIDTLLNKNYESIREKVMSTLSNIGLEPKPIDSGMDLGENRVIMSMGSIYLYASNEYVPPTDRNSNEWEKMLIQELSIASLTLSAMYDEINKIYDNRPTITEKIEGYLTRINEYEGSLPVNILSSDSYSKKLKKLDNSNKILYQDLKETTIN